MADNFGNPTPATTLVVQIEPGPIPTLTASTPASAKAIAACSVAILPAIISSGIFFYTLGNWGIPWRLSFLMGAIGWFVGIMAQTAFFGTE